MDCFHEGHARQIGAEAVVGTRSEREHGKSLHPNDVVRVARALFSAAGRPRWNSAADLNRDGRVDLIDLFIVLVSLADPQCR